MQQFLYRPNEQGDQSRLGVQRNAFSRPLIGTINIIFAAPRRIGSQPSRVLFVAQPLAEDVNPMLKRARVEVQLVLSFLEEGDGRPCNHMMML